MNKNKIFITVSVLIFAMISIFWLVGLQHACQQPVYKDDYSISESNGYLCLINNLNQKIEQKFEVPCDDSLKSLHLQIGTFSGESRSLWKAEILEARTGKQIYEGAFDAGDIEDNQYYNILNHPVEVEKGRKYNLVISPTHLENELGLAFYANDTGKRGNFIGGKEQTYFDLAMKMCGTVDENGFWAGICIADRNGFWAGIYIAVYLYVLLVFIRIWMLFKKRVPWYKDGIVQTMVLMLVYYFLQQGILNIYTFTDENDNIRGGMMIAQGSVIYRDYITQHMPFMYYLCGLFALMGAGSVPQFRLLYYIFCAGIAGFVFLRNGEKFGKCRISLFLILQPFVLYTLHGHFSLRILSDNIIAMAMVVLLLEYLDYRRSFEIDIKRSLIVASAIYVGFGCAFLSVYPIFAIAAGVIASEVIRFRKSGQPVSFYVKRYRVLFLACLIPLVLSLAYFLAKRALLSAYELAYCFNTEVYSKYSGMGSTKLEPFFNGIKNYFSTIVDTMITISVQFTTASAVELFLLMMVAVGIGMEFRKGRFFTGVSVFLFLCMCFTRRENMDNFHAAPFWNVALLIVFLSIGFTDECKIAEKQILAAAAVLVVMTCMPYAVELKENIFSDHAVEVSDWERFVVANTKEEDTVLIDLFRYESLYLEYKGRKAANRLPYFLPWYMEWYQDDTIQDLETKRPALVLYDPESEVWNFTGFMGELQEQVEEDYILDKKSGIYVRK